MIDNDSKQQVKIIELSTKQEARNTELGLQQIAKSEKKVNQLEKELDSVKKQSAELQRVVTSLKNTGQKDTPEYYKKVEESQALKDHQRNLSKSIRGQKGYQAMQKKMYGIDKKANIRYNDKGEAYLLNEQESGLYNSIKQSTQNTRVKKRVEDEFFKTEKTKSKLTGENNDKIKKVNQNLVDTNRVLNAFKASLIGFGLYKAIKGAIETGVEATNRITKNAIDMNMSAEDARSIEYVEDRLGGKAYRGTLQSVYKMGVERKSRYGIAGEGLTEGEVKAFGIAGINPELIKSMTSKDMTTLIIDRLLGKYRKDKKYDEMENLARKLGGDELVSILKTLIINPRFNNSTMAGLLREGREFTEMPKDYLYITNEYNKEMAKLFAQVDAGVSRLAIALQSLATPLLKLTNGFLSLFNPQAEKVRELFDWHIDKFGIDDFIDKNASSISFTKNGKLADYIEYTTRDRDFQKLDPERQNMIKSRMIEKERHNGVLYGNYSKSMLVKNVDTIIKTLDDGMSGTAKLDSHLYNGNTMRQILEKSKKMGEEELRTFMPKLVELAFSSGVGEGYQTGDSQFGIGGKGIDINIQLTSDQNKILEKHFPINRNSPQKTIVTEQVQR